MTDPGKVIAYNKDDDNSKGVPDYDDENANISGGGYVGVNDPEVAGVNSVAEGHVGFDPPPLN